ncbi:MAG: hypothetical protein Q9168_002642 [Polycauliona sp. 1 TL-2023]
MADPEPSQKPGLVPEDHIEASAGLTSMLITQQLRVKIFNCPPFGPTSTAAQFEEELRNLLDKENAWLGQIELDALGRFYKSRFVKMVVETETRREKNNRMIEYLMADRRKKREGEVLEREGSAKRRKIE